MNRSFLTESCQNIRETSDGVTQLRANEHLLTYTRIDLPLALHPLRPTPLQPVDYAPRARKYVPPYAGKGKAIEAWHRDWEEVKVPLVLPQISGKLFPSTGWEGNGVVEGLRVLAGLEASGLSESGANNTPLFPSTSPHLSPILRRIYPVKLRPTLREPSVPRPPPRMTRSNPSTWHYPVRLDARLLRRTYARLWNSLVWLRPVEDGWEKCSYEQMREWEGASEERSGTWAMGGDEDRCWLE